MIEQATNILHEAQGAIKALDPDGTVANNAARKAADHEATKAEQHLAESLKIMAEDVTNAIEEAKATIKDMPNAKRDLGPLLDMLGQPLIQIVSGIGLLLNGVLSLLGNIVSLFRLCPLFLERLIGGSQLDGLGLGGVIRGILSGLGLEKVLKGLGLTGLFPSPADEKKKK